MPGTEIPGCSVARELQRCCLLCSHRVEVGAGFIIPGLCLASWKPWHESTKCRPDYVSRESSLNPGAGLGVLGISAPGDSGRGLLFLTSFLLDQHIPNEQLLAATCMYCSGEDKNGWRTGDPGVGAKAGGLCLSHLFAVSAMLTLSSNFPIYFFSLQC